MERDGGLGTTPPSPGAPAAAPPAGRGREIPAYARLFIELIPTIIFMSIFYTTEPRLTAIVNASLAEGCSSLVLGILFFVYTRKVPWLMIQTTVLSVFSAVITLAFNSDLWFKLRGTVIPGFSAIVILGALSRGYNLLQLALGPYYPNLRMEGWDILAYRVAFFQLILAGLNELLHRILEFDVWVAVMRSIGISSSVLFGIFVFAPVIVHYQRTRRMYRPPGSYLQPSVVHVSLTRESRAGDAELPKVELELGSPPTRDPEGGIMSSMQSSEEGLPPVEMLAGSRVQLHVWVRTYRRTVGAMEAVVDGLGMLCIPVSSASSPLEATGQERPAGTADAGFLMPSHREAREVEYVATFSVPKGVLRRGTWMAVIQVLGAQGSQRLLWFQSVKIVGRYSKRARSWKAHDGASTSPLSPDSSTDPHATNPMPPAAGSTDGGIPPALHETSGVGRVAGAPIGAEP